MSARWSLLIGTVMWALGSSAWAEPAQTGLNGLDRELGSTGRIGVYAPRSSTPIEPPPTEADTAARMPQVPANDDHEGSEHPGAIAVLSEEEFRRTDAPVTACRVEVARRRQISPGKLAAKEVVLHFTVQANGHVREAEAVSAAGTDLEIAACAKRVVSEWVFAKHTGRDIAAQRTYRFQQSVQ
jgi:hypothetical protein